ncbi:MAG: sulfite exporter TauE/SafE family protein [Flavobacteriales bacterium]|nr:sulfite exporter TauE/SafE family protein [Flavobacteriales bacterium]
MEYWTAFTIGLLGSMHCVGMCGPIAFALPLNRASVWSIYFGSLLYNLGRLTTYFFLGLGFGLLGFGVALAGFQQSLSILVGIGMILSILIPFFLKRNLSLFSKWNLYVGAVKGSLGKRFGNKSPINLLSIGLLNGLLPCGLVYMGLAGATAMANPLNGGLFMFLFGLGTLPLMLAVSIMGSSLKLSFKNKIKKASPVFIIIIGVVFILRGMNLGIPLLSPKIVAESTEIITCHE